MLFASTILLLTFSLALAEVPANSSDSSEVEVLAANIYDDAELKDIQKKLDLLQDKEESLRLMIELQNKYLEQQFSILRNELKEPKLTVNNDSKNLSQNIDTKETIKSLPKDCAEALQTHGQNGIYEIKIPDYQLKPFNVHCVRNVNVEDSNTAPWMIIQRRQDGSIDFYRNWTEYQQGFGNLNGEFFIGLDKLHALTQSTQHELWIQMEDFEGAKRWAKYSNFAIGDSSESYALKTLGDYTGDARNSLLGHVGQKMSAKNMNNIREGGLACKISSITGAWWYGNCNYSNLNGKYLRGECPFEQGIYWYGWHSKGEGTYSLKYVHMAIRPVHKGEL